MRERVAVGVLIAILPGIALGQQPAETPDPAPLVPATTVTERTYPDNSLMPWRRAQTRTEAAGRETVTETVTVPGINGGAQPIQEVVTETVRTSPDRTQIRRDVFTFDPQRRRTLAETTQSTRETLADATTRTVHETRVSDLSGRRVLTSRQIEETSVESNTSRTDLRLFRPGVNEPLQESERIERTERRTEPGVIESNETLLVRDMNGRWQPTEKRSGEVRNVGTSERQVEETIQRLNASGILATGERVVTRHARVNGRDEVVIERYSQDVEGSFRSGDRLGLSERVRRTTTAAADGGRDIVEEVEARNPAAPGDPMRVVQRTVTTVRRTSAGRWATERRVFGLDVNGRLTPFAIEDEESVLK